MKSTFRIISLLMLVIAVIFVACVLSAPNLGQAIQIGSFRFGARQWRICYAVYAVLMAASFSASFFVKKDTKEN